MKAEKLHCDAFFSKGELPPEEKAGKGISKLPFTLPEQGLELGLLSPRVFLAAGVFPLS